MGLLLTFGYLILWLVVIFWDSSQSWGIPTLFAASFILLAIELVFSSRELLRSVFDTFQLPLLRKNLLLMWVTVAIPSVLILTDWWFIPSATVLVVALITHVGIGIAMGNMNVRLNSFPGGSRFPLDLIRLYEGSLNPNVRKAQSMFLFLIIPLLTAALVLDWRLISIVLFLQVDNIYTRLRMTVPIALFLTTRFEQSQPEWLRLKDASGELAIPSLVLSKEGEIPKSIGIHQDLVRIPADSDWRNSVRLVARYCRYVLIDTHSVSDAVKDELRMARDEDLIHKIMFIRRDEMDPYIVQEVGSLEEIAGRKMIYEVDSLCEMLATDRDKFLGGLPRSPIQKRITYSQINEKMSNKRMESND